MTVRPTLVVTAPAATTQPIATGTNVQYPRHLPTPTRAGVGATMNDEIKASQPEALTARQRMIFDFLVESSEAQGYPPTMREIGEFFGIRSTNAVHEHMRALERKGWVERVEGASRGIRVVWRGQGSADRKLARDEQRDDGGAEATVARHTSRTGDKGLSASPHRDRGRTIAVLGRVAAGVPIPAIELAEEHLTLDERLTGGGDVFALRVVGRSMVDAGILPNDLILVRATERVDNGKIAVVEIDGEVTVKRFYAERGGVRLVAENREMAPIVLDAEAAASLRIVGVVQGVVRALH